MNAHIPQYRLQNDLPDNPVMNELRKHPRWVAWAYETRKGRVTKVPKNPATGGNASTDNPATWSGYEEARECQVRCGYAGVGFVLVKGCRIQGGDLDHCMDWIGQMPVECYAETSPSGEGVRLLFLGEDQPATKSDAAGVELYSHGRFLTITGQHVPGTPTDLREAPATVAWLQARVERFRQVEEEKKDAQPLSVQAAPKAPRTTAGASGGDFWRAVNDAALADLDRWVPVLLPKARKHPTGAWRVTSHDLGRGFEEDLSIHPTGIQDFGPERSATAVDLVVAHGGAPDARAAAMWLCDRLGADPAALGWNEGARIRPKADLPDAQDDAPADLSHDELATELGRLGWDQNARYLAATEGWLFWTGNHWAADGKLHHLTDCRAFLRMKAIKLIAWAEAKAAKMIDEDPQSGPKADKVLAWAKGEARTLRNKATVAAVESLARSNPASAATPDMFDTNKMLLGTPGGVVDLTTGILRPAAREDMITKQTTVAPAPGTPTVWLRFLDEIFAGDHEVIDFMQRAAGYALTGHTSEHKLLFLYGTGRNGKSVFLNTLGGMTGDQYHRRAPAEVLLASQNERHPTALAGLAGARLVVASELTAGRTWDEALIKDLTGGDRMTARKMRQDFFDFVPELTLMIAGNSRPAFREVDEAIQARVVLVPFTVTIPAEKRDQHLPAKLRAEWPQIMQWAIDGCLAWQQRGLDVPATIRAASRDYFEDEDLLGRFLEDETTACVGAFVSNAELTDRFTQWTQQQRLADWSMNTLAKGLEKRGLQRAKGAKGIRGFRGIRLRGL